MFNLLGLFGGLILLVVLSQGCGMFRAWQAIPPPGGCDQCHTVPISANWQVAYTPPALSDERGKLSFQSPQSVASPSDRKGMSSLDLRKTDDLKCFECHKSPNESHKGRTGRFHH